MCVDRFYKLLDYILYMQVYYTSEGVKMSQVIMLIDNVDSLKHRVAGLKPGRHYSIYITAITYHPYGDDLEGSQSNPVDVKIPFTGVYITQYHKFSFYNYYYCNNSSYSGIKAPYRQLTESR